MAKTNWIAILSAVLLAGVSAEATEISLSDEQIRTIATQFATNLSKRDSCRFTEEDLYKSKVTEILARLNPQQRITFNVAADAVEDDPEFDISDHNAVDEAWCKDAKEKMKTLMGSLAPAP